ncbi:MAG: aminotransferase class III-fold pyridoxal phosphate-dependent enzyme [Acidimicrobiia bacterium]
MELGTDVDRVFDSPIPEWDMASVNTVLAEHYGLTGDLSPLPGERDQNLLLESTEGSFNVKIANVAEDPDALDMQQAALEHLAIHATGSLRYPEVRHTLQGARVAMVATAGLSFPIRLQSFIIGDPLRMVPGAVSNRDLGLVVAQVQADLAGFFHRTAGRRLLWDVRRLESLGVLGSAGDDTVDGVIADVIKRVVPDILRRLEGFEAQVVHNDLNPDNLLVQDGQVTGVVDFGDITHGPRIADLAITASYRLSGEADPAAVLSDVAAGFAAAATLAAEEVDVLPDLVAARLCQTIVISTWRGRQHPDNAEYILGDVEEACSSLLALQECDRDDLLQRVAAAAGVPAEQSPRDTDKLTKAHSSALAPSLGLSYQQPIHLTSAQGVWLTDRSGKHYLDAYNNVVQVGHGHPLVAATLSHQTRRLNTNTRYLTDEVVRYAERLCELLPHGLEVCYFTNSGSEANDLAVRIARAVTGNTGVVITNHAYHGSTTVTMAMSPEEHGTRPLEPWVATVSPPGGSEQQVGKAVMSLAERGVAPAALFLDTIFSSDGIHDPPPDYLDSAAAQIGAAGGLFVADEVQAGLGRVGPRMWGFAAGAATPDIVTLGKPIGNGHPVGAVVTTSDIAGRFADEDYFFSTFGGNNVAAAVGSAVLDITLGEELPERAERAGNYLRDGLKSITSSVIGEVRGAGLFTGVEIVNPDGEPDGPAAESILEAMKDRGVLIGRTGPHDNVLKIRPPLVFEEAHADIVLSALANVLG